MSKIVYSNEHTTDIILEFLKKNKPFIYLRYGDGDLIAMYPTSIGKTIGANNKSLITPEIQNKLFESYFVNEHNYLVGTLESIYSKTSNAKNVNFNIIDSLPFTPSPTRYSSIALQEGFMDNKEKVLQVFKILNTKNTLYINHYNHPILEKFLGKITHYIEVPKFNACNEYRKSLKQILEINPNDFDQIIMSCGQLARVIGYDLYKNFPNKTILDIGSVSDKLVINTDIINNIKVRGHISQNKEYISQTVKFLLKNLE